MPPSERASDGEPTQVAPLVVVTGTSSAVDTTLVTAALAVGFQDEGLAVGVSAAVRTGPATDPGLARLARLTGIVDAAEHVRLEGLGPPVMAAEDTAVTLPPVPVHAARWSRQCRREDIDLLLVEDPEGVLTPLDEDGSTLLDLLDLLDTGDALGVRTGVVIACRDTPDELRQLTILVAVLQARGRHILGCAMQEVGAAGSERGGAEVAELLRAVSDVPLLGKVPAGAGQWDPQQFQDRAGAWLPVT